jgi:hypothetical protein
MKSVLVLAGLGLVTLAVLACRSTPPPPPEPPAAPPAKGWPIENPPIVEMVREIEPQKDPTARELTPFEVNELRRNGTLKVQEPVKVLEIDYEMYSRSGPRKHLKVQKLAPPAPGIN